MRRWIAAAVYLGIAFTSARAIPPAPPGVHHDFLDARAPIHTTIKLEEVEKQLTGAGVEGEIHAAQSDFSQFVFTYRNPEDFFDFLNFSFLPKDQKVQEAFKSLKRHDRIKVQGEFLKNRSPQKHIEVRAFVVTKAYESPYPTEAYSYSAKLPDDLLGKTQEVFLVHAVGGEGGILVTEYKDVVVPIFAQDKSQTASLFRGDIVRLKFKIQRAPGSPTHLRLDSTQGPAVEIIQSIKELHEKPALVEGALVLFPKSPMILAPTFAVYEKTQGGGSRQYTLLNPNDADINKAIRKKLQDAWDAQGTLYINGRNKLIHKTIKIRARGVFNVEVPNQANPQILLNSAADVEILE